MKLARRGRYHNTGFTTLVDAPLYPKMPEWHDDWYLSFQVVVSNEKRTSHYVYKSNFSGDELALLVENALLGASYNGAIHAQAKAIGSFIREVLDKKNQKDFLDKKNQDEAELLEDFLDKKNQKDLLDEED